MSDQITGRATIYIDGRRIPTENKAKLNPGGANRKEERHGGKTYYAEEEVPPGVECTVLHTANVDIVALSAIVGATVIFEADTGQKYVLRGGFVTGPAELDGDRVQLKIAADSCDRM
ncbi:MAG: phage tail tube protein [Thiobacillus sp.]